MIQCAYCMRNAEENEWLWLMKRNGERSRKCGQDGQAWSYNNNWGEMLKLEGLLTKLLWFSQEVSNITQRLDR